MSTNTDILLLDGAMGTELRARGVKVPDYKSSIWSALALIEVPAEIEKLHTDYIVAGADVITASNYAVTRKLLAREGLEHCLAELTERAAKLARAACDKAERTTGRSARVAGSLPPLDTSYRADLVGTFDDNLKAYREMAALLAPHVDVLLCETMTTAAEARAAATAAAETGKTIFVSWTLAPDGRLRGGETLAEALTALEGLPIEATLINCCAMEVAAAALPVLTEGSAWCTGAYCNPVQSEPEGGEPETLPSARVEAEAYANAAMAWIEAGAKVIGGCCDTNPEYIAQLRARIDGVAPHPSCRI